MIGQFNIVDDFNWLGLCSIIHAENISVPMLMLTLNFDLLSGIWYGIRCRACVLCVTLGLSLIPYLSLACFCTFTAFARSLFGILIPDKFVIMTCYMSPTDTSSLMSECDFLELSRAWVLRILGLLGRRVLLA